MSDAPRTFLPQILHVYVVLFQIVLFFLLVHLYGDLGTPFKDFSTAALAPQGWADPLLLGTYAAGLVAFAAAFLLPPRFLRRGDKHPLTYVVGPYVIRICLFETCALAGFTMGFLRGSAFPSLPMVLLALAGTLFSLPTPGFFRRFAGISG